MSGDWGVKREGIGCEAVAGIGARMQRGRVAVEGRRRERRWGGRRLRDAGVSSGAGARYGVGAVSDPASRDPD
jgi:hypothetical protein